MTLEALEEEGGEPTTDSIQKQFDKNADALKKSLEGESKIRIARMQKEIDALKANQMRAQLPGNFLTKPLVKSFDDHLADWYPDMTTKDALDFHLKMVSESIHGSQFQGGESPATDGMVKSMVSRDSMVTEREQFRGEYDNLMKSFGEPEKYADMMKSILGDPGAPGAPGSWYNFLEENLSRTIQRIMLSNDDATALLTIPTSITSNIVPEVARLKTYGVGYGKHTMGFEEGASAIYGGGQLMDRLTNTLVQRGIRCLVTEMLIANKQKLINLNPLAYERELRILEFNLGKSHNLLYGDKDINPSGTTVLEVDGMLKQMQDATTGYLKHVRDWDGIAFNATTQNPLHIFRDVAEKLIINGHLPGGVITGKYSVIMDYGVANNISTVVDEKQRIMIEKYEQAAMYYGQSFSGFVTDLGTFRFKRSKTLHLTANDTWTLAADVSNNAIAWPAIAITAIPQATAGEKVAALLPDKLDLPIGSYTYRVSVVNDHGESDISDAEPTTTDGTTPADVAATQSVEISIPYDAAFAGGTVGGYVVSPARYFILYRGNAGETDDTKLKAIAKIPINGVSTTTYVDWNQKIPGTTDMFFICNNPLDISHINLVPNFEIPLYDIAKGSSRQWMIMDIGGLAVWAPQRNFVYRNVPGFVAP